MKVDRIGWMSIPLSIARLCPDCEMISGKQNCPQCGTPGLSLARVLSGEKIAEEKEKDD